MNWLLPTFLFAALMLGGSAQAPGAILLLELGGLALLGWSYARAPSAPVAKSARQLTILYWAAAALAVVQLVPLPPILWHALPGREAIAAGDALLGIALWRPLSLAPEATIACLMAFAIPLGVLSAGLRLPTVSRPAILWAIVSAAMLGAMLGLAQRAGQAPRFFDFTSTGPTGQFANTNHLAALATAALPALGALVATARDRVWRAIGGLAAIVLALVVIATGALAMIALLVPALVAAAVIAVGKPTRLQAAVGGGALLLFAIPALMFADTGGWAAAEVSGASRADIWGHAWQAAPSMALGNGFGTFPQVYATTEDPLTITTFYVNHAHNELLEVVLDGGVPALALAGLLVGWWARASWAAWRGAGEADPFARAGSVAAAVLLLHSLVDFPLRTSAHAALLAAGLLLLAMSRPPTPVVDKRDLRPTRHRRVR